MDTWGLFRGWEQPGCDAGHWPPSSAEIKKECTYTSTLPLCLQGLQWYSVTLLLSNFTIMDLFTKACWKLNANVSYKFHIANDTSASIIWTGYLLEGDFFFEEEFWNAVDTFSLKIRYILGSSLWNGARLPRITEKLGLHGILSL